MIRSLSPIAAPAAYTLPPPPDPQAPLPDQLHAAPVVHGAPLQVNRTAFNRITLADLQPGDIGFQLQRSARDFKQFWITVGGRYATWRRRKFMPTDPFVVHAFVVVKPHPKSMRLHTIDGASDNYTGIDDLMMNFGANKFRVVPKARYVFFRANEPDLSALFSVFP